MEQDERTLTAYPGTQAVRRAVSLLKAFGPERPELSLVALSRAAGLHKTTAYRLLSALQGEGLVERVAGGESYRLGPELMALGSRALGAGDLRAAGRPELEALALRTHETVTLEVLVVRESLILDECKGPHVIGARPEVGTRWPAHATSTGKVLLAYLPSEERAAWLRGPLPGFTPRTLTDRADLERELTRVRDRGYAISAEELEPGFVAVGAPVRVAGGRVVAAVSVGGPRGRLTPGAVTNLAVALPEAAARLSRRLGWSPAATEPDAVAPARTPHQPRRSAPGRSRTGKARR